MFKVLTINGKDYHLEYTIEASLYEDATHKLMEFLTGAVVSVGDGPNAREAISESLRTVSNIPQTALTLFYAGLLEHHGPFGDQTINSRADAKALVRKYFEEHAEDGTDNFLDLLNLCLEQMEADGFFKHTGLAKVMLAMQDETAPANREQRRATKKKASEKQ